jgi:predicted RecA/RadA family phage recombinase
MARKNKTPAEAAASAETLTTAAAEPAAAEPQEEILMQNMVQDGKTINITPAADVAGGDLVVFPGMVAVAITDIAAGTEGAAATEGVFGLPKDGTALAQGQAVYANSGGQVSATNSLGFQAGVAWAEATGSDDIALVKINA